MHKFWLAGLLGLVVSGPAQAGPILGNFPPPSSAPAASTASPLTIAVEFTTGAAVQILGDAMFDIGGNAQATVTLNAIDATSPNQPGAVLATVGSTTINTSSGTVQPTTFTAATPIVLTPLTSFWIVLTEQPTSGGSFLFAVTAPTPTGTGASYVQQYYSNSFFLIGGIPYFQLDTPAAAAAVPEPSSLALCWIAGVTILGLRRVRRRAGLA